MNEGNGIRVGDVKYKGDYTLRCRWANEKALVVNLREPSFRLKGMRPLRDTAAFALAGVGEGGHSVVWPGEIDMGAARLLEIALERSRRQVAYYASGEHEVPRTVLLACKGWEVERPGCGVTHPYVAPRTAKIHTLITLGIRHRAKALVFQLRKACPCGYRRDFLRFMWFSSPTSTFHAPPDPHNS